MRFGDFELALDRYELRLRGRLMKVEPRVLEVLAYLVEHRRRIVSKDELIETLWEGASVSDAALARAVGQARRVLKDAEDSLYSIQTVYGRGFRFIADDSAPAEETSDEPELETGADSLEPEGADVPRPPSIATVQAIAVLPFEDMSPGQDQRHFCDGLVEELITGLSTLAHLRVVARTSTFAYRDRKTDVRTIGRELEVDALIEGSVRTHGDKFRITLLLVDSAGGCVLWCQRFDQAPDDIYALQERIARSVVEVMREPIDSRVTHPVRVGPSTVIEAYEAYLRGRELFRRFTISTLRESREAFRQAVAIDPSYALAFAGIADSSSFLFFFRGRSPEDRRQSEEASLRALELGPDLALAHASRGTALWVAGLFDEAEASFLNARRLDSSLFEVEYFFGRFNLARGRHQEAAESLRRALEIRPSSFDSALQLSMALRSLGQGEAAKTYLRQAVASSQLLLQHFPDDLRTLANSAVPLLFEGRSEEALSNLDRCFAKHDGDPVILYNVACAYVVAERYDRAVEVLTSAIDEGFSDWNWMTHDPDLEPLRLRPEYHLLLDRARRQAGSEA